MILISHDHYDHLDTNSITELHQNYKPIIVAGLNTEDVLPKNKN